MTISLRGRTNVVIAAYTTAQARLKLYSYLESLGDRTLYADTDSIIFTARLGEWSPPLGDYLGVITDETPGKNLSLAVKKTMGLLSKTDMERRAHVAK